MLGGCVPAAVLVRAPLAHIHSLTSLRLISSSGAVLRMSNEADTTVLTGNPWACHQSVTAPPAVRSAVTQSLGAVWEGPANSAGSDRPISAVVSVWPSIRAQAGLA